MNRAPEPAVWFPAIRAGSGTDVFTERLAEGLGQRGLRAEITWLPHRAEYAPWTISPLKPPPWANIAHVNTWLHQRFIPPDLPLVATMHLCVHDPALAPYKSRTQALYHRLWVKRLEQKVLALAQRVVAVSRYAEERTNAAFSPREIEVIHNGIDLDTFRPAQEKETHHPFRLLYVGNWSSRKGADLLAPIMARIGSDFELRYAANRYPAGQPQGFPAGCRPLGRLATPQAMARAYHEVDALLFPTRLEGFGLVALEAQACGLPVIASRGSSLPEVVADGETGLLCPQDDVAAFAAAARRLATDTSLWRHMSQAARARVEARFGIDAMIDRYIALYRAALDTSP